MRSLEVSREVHVFVFVWRAKVEAGRIDLNSAFLLLTSSVSVPFAESSHILWKGLAQII